MRFNNKELSVLAQQGSEKFEKEGVLRMKQKQDKLFKKGEAYVERFFRLRGNLLFYFKGRDAKSEPIGLLVLERCAVELLTREEIEFSFIIVYEGEDQNYTLAAQSEEERDAWITALHIASYECLKMQLQSLREQVQARTGRDPLVQNLPLETGMEFETQSGTAVDDPVMEISLCIEGLPNDSNGQPPNPFVVIYTIIPPQQQTWLQHNHTEMVEKNNSPHFLKTVGFGDTGGLESNTRVKATVFHVKERMTGTMSQMGQVIFTLKDILMADDMNLSLSLVGSDSSKIGDLKIVAWLNESSSMSLTDLQNEVERSQELISSTHRHTAGRATMNSPLLDDSSQPRTRQSTLTARRRSKRLETLRPMCNNIITRTFRFDTSSEGVKLLVYEYMAESKFTFEVPIKFLKLLIDEEQQRIAKLQDLGKLPPIAESFVAAAIDSCAAIVSEYTDAVNLLACHQDYIVEFIDDRKQKRVLLANPGKILIYSNSFLPHITYWQLPVAWASACQEYQDIGMSCISMYSQNSRFLAGYKGSNFKPSSKKFDKELEFVPVNLHLQRMTVVNEATDSSGCYDIITTGAYSAHARRYRSGGVCKMVQQLQDQYSPLGTLSKVTKVKRACELVNTLYDLQAEIKVLCDSVCHEALQGDGESLQKATDNLAQKVIELVRECESPVLQETASRLADLQEEAEAEAEARAKSSHADQLKPDDKSPEKSWKWSGSCFVKSPTVEPWDMTRVNTEASLVCLTSMVEDIVTNKSGAMDRPKWLGEISPAVIKLKSFVEIVCQRSAYFMSFLDLMENKDNLKLVHTVKCRRDVVFCQALTSLVTGFVCLVNTKINNATALNNISRIGVIVETEGLLSCHGEETAMLEDMVVGVDDLSTVTFKLTEETPLNASITLSPTKHLRSGLYPDLNRRHICVEVPVKKSLFEKLPARLQQGHCVKVVPLFFNVGINEQATLAEKFGNTGVQERTNEVSLGRLNSYIEQYEDELGSPDHGRTGIGSTQDLLSQLRYNVYTKKSKNVEILHVAAELCRKLHGIRFTSCKSAKDRTAMSVTLEQVQILQQEHDLASHVFTHALDCFRSEGVRRENTFKNIGSRKYAFNSLQLLSFPKQYRPPNGTYGNVQG